MDYPVGAGHGRRSRVRDGEGQWRPCRHERSLGGPRKNRTRLRLLEMPRPTDLCGSPQVSECVPTQKLLVEG
jgi:hypothetical protein